MLNLYQIEKIGEVIIIKLNKYVLNRSVEKKNV